MVVVLLVLVLLLLLMMIMVVVVVLLLLPVLLLAPVSLLLVLTPLPLYRRGPQQADPSDDRQDHRQPLRGGDQRARAVT